MVKNKKRKIKFTRKKTQSTSLKQKDLQILKQAYKKGKLRFDSKDLAEEILKLFTSQYKT